MIENSDKTLEIISKENVELTDEMRKYLKHCWSGSVYEFCVRFNISGIMMGDKLVQKWIGEDSIKPLANKNK